VHPARDSVKPWLALYTWGVITLIEPRARDLGGFVVGRVLPAPRQRTVGPFCFLDHMGPVTLAPGHGIDVRPHPHIGLATVTYLFEGEIVHRDSLGFEQAIHPGDINWMTAGRGIVHSERSSDARRAQGGPVHGLQLWTALPRADEETTPDFHHHPAASLPRVDQPGVHLRVLVGSAYGAVSPVATFAPTLYVDAELDAGATLPLPTDHEERAVYLVEGAVRAADVVLTRPGLLVFSADETVSLVADTASRLVLLGGAPLDGPRHMFWNFVSSSEERIERAKVDWREERFPLVPGDERERTPLPPA
jgi:redox-sensitive bicupin YhaK (pirin superfamily)